MAPTSLSDRYGKWAVITGASSGIGAAFATVLASHHLNLILTARRVQHLTSLAQTLRDQYSIQTLILPADLSQTVSYHSLLSSVAHLDVGLFICNAGIELHGSFFHNTRDAHLNLVQINVASSTALTHGLVRRMVEQGRGGVIIVSSFTHRPHAWYATYSASKAYLSSFGLILREEVRRKGVDVLVLEPGAVRSEMLDRMSETIALDTIRMPVCSAERCAKEGVWALTRGKAKWTPGWTFRIGLWFLGFLPDQWIVWMTSFVLRKTMHQDCFEYT